MLTSNRSFVNGSFNGYSRGMHRRKSPSEADPLGPTSQSIHANLFEISKNNPKNKLDRNINEIDYEKNKT
jgi:hypothetical protein